MPFFPTLPSAQFNRSRQNFAFRKQGVDDAATISGKPFVVTLLPVAPGIYREGYDCRYPSVCGLTAGPDAAHSTQRGALVDGNGRLITSANPLLARNIYSLYLTGLGIANSPAASFQSPDSRISLAAAFTVYPVVHYYGPAPGYPGLYQVNFELPQDLRRALTGDGSLPICSGLTEDLRIEMHLTVSGTMSSTSGDSVDVPILLHPNELDCRR